MQLKKSSLAWSALALAITLAACGGGGGSDASSPANAANSTTPAAPGATSTQASALYAGPISGFGSVIVNGMRFSSVGATLVDDDAQTISLAQLKLGMTLRVTGTTDDANLLGTASLLELVHGNRGQVTAIDVNAGTLTLLGQTVATNIATSYQGATGLAAVTVGQTVEVYGALQADGSLLATLVELKSAITSINLIGRMKSVTPTSFQVGNLTVDYSAATLKGVPGENKQVKIKAATGPVGNVLSASSVQVFDSGSVYGASVAAGTRMKVKGVAGSAPVNGLLTLSGTQVNVAQAAIKGNAAITKGQFIEVKGNWDGSVLQATEVEMEGYRESEIGGRNELYGTVSSIDAGIAVVNGVTVDLNRAVFSHGSLAQMAVGSYVEIKGNLSGSTLQATKVELKSGSNATGASYEQYGQVANFVSAASFKVNGLQVDASQARFEHGNALANGSYVEIKGSLNASGVFIASKVDIKNSVND
jgi:cytoskeletal protein CcmA (bactofilin family)